MRIRELEQENTYLLRENEELRRQLEEKNTQLRPDIGRRSTMPTTIVDGDRRIDRSSDMNLRRRRTDDVYMVRLLCGVLFTLENPFQHHFSRTETIPIFRAPLLLCLSPRSTTNTPNRQTLPPCTINDLPLRRLFSHLMHYLIKSRELHQVPRRVLRPRTSRRVFLPFCPVLLQGKIARAKRTRDPSDDLFSSFTHSSLLTITHLQLTLITVRPPRPQTTLFFLRSLTRLGNTTLSRSRKTLTM